MTDSMIERVARAIWNTKPGAKIHPWERLGTVRNDYLAEARAAIEAMRTPTEAMVRAGSYAVDEFLHDDTETECWHAMIDAALKASE